MALTPSRPRHDAAKKKPQPGLPAEAFASGQREAEKAQVSPAADGSSPVLVRRADLDGLHAGLGLSLGLVDAVAADHGHFR
jgi:hypothetical protein